MKQIRFLDPNNESLWLNFESLVKSLASQHGIKLVEDSFSNPILVTLTWTGGRGFDGIEEKFVVEQDLWFKVKPVLQNHEIYFGEIAGKHSEVYGTLDDGDIIENNYRPNVESFLKEKGKHQFGTHLFTDCLLNNLKENDPAVNKDSILVLQELVDSLK